MDLTSLKHELHNIHASLCNGGTTSEEAADIALTQVMSQLSLSVPVPEIDMEQIYREFRKSLGLSCDDETMRKDDQEMSELMADPERFDAWIGEAFGRTEEEAVVKTFEYERLPSGEFVKARPLTVEEIAEYAAMMRGIFGGSDDPTVKPEDPAARQGQQAVGAKRKFSG